MVQRRAGNFTRAREIEFGRDPNGWRIRDETRVGLVIFFGRELQPRIARTRQAAHKVRVNPKPGGHDLRADVLEFECAQKIRSIQRVRDPHREGEREIEIREISSIKFALERVANVLNAPGPIANIAMLRATIRCRGPQLILAPTKLECCIPNPI